MQPPPISSASAGVPDIRADRRLLLPGPCPPLSHLGATLLRHAVHTSLRYALYHLGQPLPESPPTRFVALRLYLDAPALAKALGRGAGAREILGALLDPGGQAVEALPMRLRGTLWFHRWRRRVPGLQDASSVRFWAGSPKPQPAELASCRPGTQLTRLLPALGEALLGDLISVLDRRKTRASGRLAGPVQSREARRFLEGGRADLAKLGSPDALVSSWRGEGPPNVPDAAASALGAYPGHRLRGGFRERYRITLDRLRPSLLAAGSRAVAKGYLDSEEDLFFLPLELIDDLEGDSKPNWLDDAIESNRAEWSELRGRNAPAETLGNVEPAPRLDLPAEMLPLWPLA